jgi:hypothetical protein
MFIDETISKEPLIHATMLYVHNYMICVRVMVDGRRVLCSQVPVFQRGGHIVPRRLRERRSSSLTVHDPFTLIVALDKKVSV